MFRMYGKVVLAGSMLVLLFLLAACDSGGGSQTPASTTIKITPTVIRPRSVAGTPGIGPIVVTSPTPVPGGNSNSQQVVLADRTLVLNSVSKQDSANVDSSLITLVLTVKNTSDKPIKNNPDFFQLIGAEGDIFTYQSNSSDNFYGVVSSHSSLDGTIAFPMPKAAASHLQLLYRPEVEAETVLMPLKV